jgi:hypothetical protein
MKEILVGYYASCRRATWTERWKYGGSFIPVVILSQYGREMILDKAEKAFNTPAECTDFLRREVKSFLYLGERPPQDG